MKDLDLPARCSRIIDVKDDCTHPDCDCPVVRESPSDSLKRYCLEVRSYFCRGRDKHARDLFHS